MAKMVLYDESRELFLARIHDGQGNLYTFNIPPETPLDVKSILETGEVVAIRRKGESSKNLDGTSDGNYRMHNSLTPIEPADLSLEEIQTLIDENLKTALPPGEWTRRVKPLEKKPSAKQKMFRGKPVIVEGGKAHIKGERHCSKCKTMFEGRQMLTLDEKGEVKRTQAFRADDKTFKRIGDLWLCGECREVPPASKPAPRLKKEEPIPLEGGTEFTTINYFRFKECEGKFYFRGNEIIRDPTRKTASVCSIINCHQCRSEIKMVAAVTIRDGKPFRVATNKPANRSLARPIKPKSNHWLCESCVKGETKPIEISPQIEEPVIEEVVPILPEIKAPASQTYVEIPFKNAIKKLEEMAMDAAVDDKVFRGAAYMLTLALREE